MKTTIASSTKVAQIVLDHPETARIFAAHRIDYCCGGDAPLARLCAQRGVDADALVRELEAAVARRNGSTEDDARSLTTAELLGRIVTRHHGYLRTSMPFLDPLARKVARVHGDHDPRLRVVAEKFAELRTTLETHLDFEEDELFPALLAKTPRNPLVSRELEEMSAEHRAVGEALENLRSLTDDYTAPTWACTSYRTLLAELARLEDDVMRHVHLENHVLMPRFVERTPAMSA